MLRSRAALVLLAPLGAVALASAQSTTRVSLSSLGKVGDQTSSTPSLSADGRFVAFESRSTDLVRADVNDEQDVFVHDRATGVTECVSVTPAGLPGSGASFTPLLSADGRFVCFTSSAEDLVPGDGNGQADTFLRDRQTGQTFLVSLSSGGAQGNSFALAAGVSDDGRFVCFESDASNLAAGDVNGLRDVFVRDRSSGTTTCVSVTPSGAVANGDSARARLSADGLRVAFDSRSTDLVAAGADGSWTVYLRDLPSGSTTKVSPASGVDHFCSSISADGSAVGYWGGGGPSGADAIVFDVATGQSGEVSLSSQGQSANGASVHPILSADGRFVVFGSTGDNLVPGDDNHATDHFLRDRLLGTTALVSLTANGGPIAGASFTGTLSADGAHVAFACGTVGVVPYATSGGDIYARDLQGCTTTLARYCTATASSLPGCVATLDAAGVPTLSAPAGFTLTAGPLPGGVHGGFLWTLLGPAALPLGPQGALLCLGERRHAGPPQLAGGTPGSCDGRLAIDLATLTAGAPVTLAPGALLHLQAWVRDPGAPGGLALSDALWTQVCP